jgi:hypothetical protein
MLRKFTAPFVLFALAISLAGCIYPGYYHHDHYDGGGDGGYNHGPGPGPGPGYDHGPGGGGYYQH